MKPYTRVVKAIRAARESQAEDILHEVILHAQEEAIRGAVNSLAPFHDDFDHNMREIVYKAFFTQKNKLRPETRYVAYNVFYKAFKEQAARSFVDGDAFVPSEAA